ncbi:MAG: GxxExxY protein [Melioribacteraceae bacterium]|nr:GxxExxY protein [Melioribacteraceae bacterium]
MSNIIYKEESYAIQGAIFEVYSEMGNGYLEAVYQECLEIEFETKNVSYISQPTLKLKYKKRKLKKSYKPDFICFNKIIVEIKGVKAIAKEHQAQVLNYLKATELKLGLIVNFGAYPKVEIKRIAL